VHRSRPSPSAPQRNGQLASDVGRNGDAARSPSATKNISTSGSERSETPGCASAIVPLMLPARMLIVPIAIATPAYAVNDQAMTPAAQQAGDDEHRDGRTIAEEGRAPPRFEPVTR